MNGEEVFVFFDLDETLLDHRSAERQAALDFYGKFKSAMALSDDDFVSLWHSVAEKHFELYQRGQTTFQGQRRARLREIFNDQNEFVSDEHADAIFEIYLRSYEEHWASFPDVLACLEALKSFRLGIITNGVSDQQNKKLRKTGIQGRFSTIICSEAVGVSKPNPEIFLIAAKEAGLDPSDCFHVGDRLETDALAASKAGMRGVWLNRAGESKMTAGIDEIRSLKELPDLIHQALK